LAWFGLSPTPNAFGVTPAPDGGYVNDNTAEGDNALNSLTSGQDNTAIGFAALAINEIGDYNTATGSAALNGNSSGAYNTATGFRALVVTNADDNTATGALALQADTTGFYKSIRPVSLARSNPRPATRNKLSRWTKTAKGFLS
jgi:hypothetical protein